MITIEQLWSRFLFNQNQAPIGDALLDGKYIRNSDLENTKGDVVEISASEFQNKYGKFVKAMDS